MGGISRVGRWIRRGGTYGIEVAVAVAFCGCVEGVEAVVGVEIEEKAFEVGDLAVFCGVDLGQSVDCADSIFYRFELLCRDRVAFVDHDYVGVRYLGMCGRHVKTLMVLVVSLIC